MPHRGAFAVVDMSFTQSIGKKSPNVDQIGDSAVHPRDLHE